jgi:hypothetical protein
VPSTPAPPRPTAVAALLAATALGTIAFWLLYATTDLLVTSDTPIFRAWERSFPVADAWMALSAAVAATLLWRGARSGWAAALVFGGASVFLGLIDATFFLENDLYRPLRADAVLEIGLQTWCLGFGAFVLATAARRLRTPT